MGYRSTKGRVFSIAAKCIVVTSLETVTTADDVAVSATLGSVAVMGAAPMSCSMKIIVASDGINNAKPELLAIMDIVVMHK